MRSFLLAILLSLLWIGMSGHFEPLLLILGALSVTGVSILVWRMRIVDREGVPVQHGLRTAGYGFWLAREMVTSALSVARTVTSRRMAIQPQALTVEGVPGDPVAQTLYANSITLTPGTATLDVDDGHLLVHALTDEAAAGVRSGEMRRRVLATLKPADRPIEEALRPPTD